MKWGIRKDVPSNKLSRGLSKAVTGPILRTPAGNLVGLPLNPARRDANRISAKHISALNKKWKEKAKNGEIKTDGKAREQYHKELQDTINNKIYPEFSAKYMPSYTSSITRSGYVMRYNIPKRFPARANLTVGRVNLRPAHADEPGKVVAKRAMKGYSVDPNKFRVTAEAAANKSKNLRHADEDLDFDVSKLNYELVFDEDGLAVEINIPETELKHYGVKGMKWGVRKDEPYAAIGSLGQSASIVVGGEGSQLGERQALHEAASKARNLSDQEGKRILQSIQKTNQLYASPSHRKKFPDGPNKDRRYMTDVRKHVTDAVNRKLPDGLTARIYTDWNNPSRDMPIVIGTPAGHELIRKAYEKQYKTEFVHADSEPETVEVSYTEVFDEDGFVVDFSIGELKHFGVKGMKWGVRKKRESSSEESSGSSEGEKRQVVGAASGESSGDRYARLVAQAKRSGSHSLSDQDLKFVNTRTEAMAKMDKLYETKPNWLAEATKKAAQQAVQNTLNSVANGIAQKYVSGPLLDTFLKAKDKDAKDKAPTSTEASTTGPASQGGGKARQWPRVRFPTRKRGKSNDPRDVVIDVNSYDVGSTPPRQITDGS